MKPAPFEYHRPEDLDSALGLLAAHDDVAKPIAGGQSLIPMLNLRLARPGMLIDLNPVAGLSGVRRVEGSLHVGATTRQSDLLGSDLAARHWPILPEGMAWIAHPQIRNRGTVGGSLAHADPAAELPVLMTALDARFVVRSTRGAREVAADDFFVTHLTTAMEPDELLVEIVVPPPAEGQVAAFAEFARRHGDFALGGAAVVATVDPGGVVRSLRAVLLGAGSTPVRAQAAESILVGETLSTEAIAEAAAAAAAELEPTADLHASAAYRRQLLGRMLRDALGTAAGRHLVESAA